MPDEYSPEKLCVLIGELKATVESVNVRLTSLEGEVKDTRTFLQNWKGGLKLLVSLCVAGAFFLNTWDHILSVGHWIGGKLLVLNAGR